MASGAHYQSATTTLIHEFPALLLVQGSFQTPQFYQNLVECLENVGYSVAYPRLPSCANTDHPDFPRVTLIDDALAVRSELTRLIEDEGKTVVVVMHSYGGLAGSEATREELSYAKRQLQGLPGGVIHLFLCAAWLLDEGQSVIDAFGESKDTHLLVSSSSHL